MSQVKVFLIDDDDDDRMLFELALRECNTGFKLSTAIDGIAAYERFTDPTFPRQDVIFLDINMPRMNGKELIVRMSSLARHESTPVIVYSTSSISEDVRYMLESGAYSFITKANSYRKLCSDIEGVLAELSLKESSTGC